jgi:hypothetical protein
LRALVEGVGPNNNVVQRMEFARGVTGADIEHLVSGNVDVDQSMTYAENVTGFKAKTVGGQPQRSVPQTTSVTGPSPDSAASWAGGLGARV